MQNIKPIPNVSVNFLKQIAETAVFEKKLINKNLYSKFLVCNKINRFSEFETYAIEDNFNTFHINSTDCKKFIFAKSKNKNFSGHSLLGNSYTFTSKFNDVIVFKSFLTKGYFYKPLDFVSSFRKNLGSFYKPLKRSIRRCLLLNPVKGGFKVYSFGFTAFLPYKHYVVSLRKFFFSKKKFYKSNVLSLIKLSVSRASLIKKYFLVRLPLFLGSLKVLPGFKKRNYSKTVRKKRKQNIADLNFVFLSFKQKRKWRKKKTF